MRFIKPERPVDTAYVHCSASDNPDHDNAATMDAWHKARGWNGIGYHFFGRKDGTVEFGRDVEKTPAAQGAYNRRSLAYCMHGLDIDKFTKEELASMVEWCWQVHEAYGGAMQFKGHNEVSNKTCPVIDLHKVLNLSLSGKLTGPRPKPIELKSPDYSQPTRNENITLRHGDEGFQVEALQRQLTSLGYHVGMIDKQFGTRTRAAVLAFQADNHLITDGIVGSATQEAFSDAKSRAIGEDRKNATLTSLAEDGSRIADASLKNIAVGGVTTTIGILGILAEFSKTFELLKNQVAPVAEPFGGITPMLALGLLGIVGLMTWQNMRSGKARVEDHQTGKTS